MVGGDLRRLAAVALGEFESQATERWETARTSLSGLRPRLPPISRLPSCAAEFGNLQETGHSEGVSWMGIQSPAHFCRDSLHYYLIWINCDASRVGILYKLNLS